jgi:L-arabinokinase
VRVRALDDVRASGDLPWFAPALDRLRALPNDADASLATFLDWRRPLIIARAPGRLDVMGGIADYSGALVLEMPLDRATFAAAQRQAAPRLEIVSLRGDATCRFAIDLETLLTGALRAPDALARWFADRDADRWAAYVIGAVYRCLTLAEAAPLGSRAGLRLLITSHVPEGKGVSSSAALEVATMAAAAAAYEIDMTAVDLAAACQWVENHIAGAPCGIMDQMTAACGRRDRLLRLRCQPATVEGHVQVPAGFRFYGIDSGIRHAVTGADYATVRAAAFMGYRMVAEAEGLPVRADGALVRIEDDRWHGYLANITPAEFTERFEHRLPARMQGVEFLARFGGTTDIVTRVEPERWYPVRQATAHPIHEQSRVTRFAELLTTGLDRPEAAPHMGALMYLSHASYGDCGLGSDGTDRLIDLVGIAGPPRGLFGAKITGGGSGGTVAVFGTEAARATVREIARRYERDTGRAATVFDGSGPGAEEIGVLVIPGGAMR